MDDTCATHPKDAMDAMKLAVGRLGIFMSLEECSRVLNGLKANGFVLVSAKSPVTDSMRRETEESCARECDAIREQYLRQAMQAATPKDHGPVPPSWVDVFVRFANVADTCAERIRERSMF